MKPTYFFIPTAGGIHAVADERAERIALLIGSTEKRRASNVVPACPFQRLAFKAIRAISGEHGRLAQWARTWRATWQVRFTDTPDKVSFSHVSRHVAIKWEIDQLERRFAQQ